MAGGQKDGSKLHAVSSHSNGLRGCSEAGCLKYSNQDEDGVRQALQSLKESYKEGRLNSW